MHIKGLILDGFKTYGKRTHIEGFDPEFNAITGLNGTGKSNILDAICFVLGITNLKNVRAATYQDLVYKSGQAGINRATVTIIFDNNDDAHCPLGFEGCNEISVTRQIVVGGKNKYLINGKNVPNKKVHDLFCSVQLNVNNPNFLIMQGCITKVLNMKPSEILSMVEEAAGTSMYQQKRESAISMIELKDNKLADLESLITEEVLPKLEKLRKERVQFIEFQKIGREIQFLTRIHVSHKYLLCREMIENGANKIETVEDCIVTNKNKILEYKEHAKQLESDTKAMQEKIDRANGGDLNQLDQELNQQLKVEAVAAGQKKSIESEVVAENKNLKALIKTTKEDEAILKKKLEEMACGGDVFEQLKQDNDNDANAYVAAQKKYEAISAGLAMNEDGEAATLQDQLITAKHQQSEAVTTIKQSEMELKHNEKELSSKKNEAQSQDTAYVKDKKICDYLSNEIRQLEEKLKKFAFDENEFDELQQQRQIMEQEKRQMNAQLNDKNAHRFDFQYQDPESNFDRRRVRGRVCKLFDVRNQRNSLALSMCAGGALYSVVVVDDQTGKKILERGQLQQRTTIIPINRMNGRSMEPERVRRAQQLVGPENCSPAMDLIEYSSDYEVVMMHVFGNTFICRDMNAAKLVTYDRKILRRSVTWDGDVFDPDGTLSGGSRPQGDAVLVEVGEIKKLQNELNLREQKLSIINRKLSQLEQIESNYSQCKTLLEQKQHELKTVSGRLAQTSFQRHQQEVEELEKSIASLKKTIIAAREMQLKATKKVNDISEKLADAAGYRERELNAAETEMKRMKKKSEESKTKWQQREQEYETKNLEIQELKNAVKGSSEQITKLKEKIQKLLDDVSQLSSNSEKTTSAIDALKAKIKEHKDEQSARNHELKSKLHKRDKILKTCNELELDIKKKENEINNVKAEGKDALNRMRRLESKYDWIERDKDAFGVKNTAYDYSKQDPTEAEDKLKQAQESRTSMEKHINQKAMVMLEREEIQHNEVIRRKEIVINDKQKILKNIAFLDEKKKSKVESAAKQVNKNLSGIFSSLLPGSDAELKAHDKNNVMTGLEVIVSFNGVEKGLNELSGGQRSLIALSLTLAMLKYNPAPIYILDEVDAALDMSHTQNIGSMLKEHFKNSQFIIVSLKDGMFNNANVLYRTKFEDGVSDVVRVANLN